MKNEIIKPRHFLRLDDLTSEELRAIISRGLELKQMIKTRQSHANLAGRSLCMLFEKHSTRTRVSFEVGIAQLGGHSLCIFQQDSQLHRGEPIEDTARVISSMVDCVMYRTHGHERIQRFADYSSVPVINGLSDDHHPCQLLADMMTYIEHREAINGRIVAWLGAGNNMCHSYIHAAQLLDFQLNIACPEGYQPKPDILSASGDHAILITDPKQAVKDADLVVTDVWASMGEENKIVNQQVFLDYQVNQELMSLAKTDALFMHCLPAHRDQEVSTEVLEGSQSVVWDEAENRLHSQKALLELLLK